jgi:hypothetical protein
MAEEEKSKKVVPQEAKETKEAPAKQEELQKVKLLKQKRDMNDLKENGNLSDGLLLILDLHIIILLSMLLTSQVQNPYSK